MARKKDTVISDMVENMTAAEQWEILSKRAYFPIYLDKAELAAESLNNDELATLFRLLIDHYVNNREPPSDCDRVILWAYKSMITADTANNRKYIETTLKRQKAASVRWARSEGAPVKEKPPAGSQTAPTTQKAAAFTPDLPTEEYIKANDLPFR